MHSDQRLRSVAERFARALDQSDWKAAALLLHPKCRYNCRGSVVIGPTLLDGYRTTDEWVKSTFDAVRYESRVEVEGGRVRIHFRDLIDHGDHHLDFSCQQVLTIDDGGHIVSIEHVDLPGEVEKADAFNQACGVRRPSAHPS